MNQPSSGSRRTMADRLQIDADKMEQFTEDHNGTKEGH